MITIPVYELLLLPEVTFFFKKICFRKAELKNRISEKKFSFRFTEERNSPRGNFHGKYFSSGRDGNH